MRKLNVNSEQPFTGLLEQPIIMNFCYLAVTYLSISYPKSPSEGVPYIIANLLIAVLKDRDIYVYVVKGTSFPSVSVWFCLLLMYWRAFQGQRMLKCLTGTEVQPPPVFRSGTSFRSVRSQGRWGRVRAELAVDLTLLHVVHRNTITVLSLAQRNSTKR